MHTHMHLFPTVSKVHSIADKAPEMKQKHARGSIEKNRREIQYTPKLKLKSSGKRCKVNRISQIGSEGQSKR